MTDAGLFVIFAGVVMLIIVGLTEIMLRRYTPVLPKLAERAPLIRGMETAIAVLSLAAFAVALLLLRE